MCSLSSAVLIVYQQFGGETEKQGGGLGCGV